MSAYSPVDRPLNGGSERVIAQEQIRHMTDLFGWSSSFANLALQYVVDGTVNDLQEYYYSSESVNQRQHILERTLTLPEFEQEDDMHVNSVTYYNGNRAASYALNYYRYPGNENFYTAMSSGGDCTNFVSQCVSYGFGTKNDLEAPSYDRTAFPMHTTNSYDTGWYAGTGGGSYAWENVEGHWAYLVNRPSNEYGAHANWQYLIDLTLGSVVQVSYDGGNSYGHSTIVCSTRSPSQPGDNTVPYHGNYLLAQHSTGAQGYTLRRLSYWADNVYAKRFYLPYRFVRN